MKLDGSKGGASLYILPTLAKCLLMFARCIQIIVFFVNEEKLGAQKMLEYINRMKEDQIYRGILILQKKLSGPANSERMLVKNSYRIEDVRFLLFFTPEL